LFILHAKKEASLISINSLCQLIKLEDYEILEKLFNFKYYDDHFILKMLFMYKNKIKVTKKEFKAFIYNFNNAIIKIITKRIQSFHL